MPLLRNSKSTRFSLYTIPFDVRKYQRSPKFPPASMRTICSTFPSVHKGIAVFDDVILYKPLSEAARNLEGYYEADIVSDIRTEDEKKADEKFEGSKKAAPNSENKRNETSSGQNEKRNFDSVKKEEKQFERKKTDSSMASIDFASKRPNVKAGNLADSGRRNNRGQGNRPQRPGGQGQGQTGQGRRRESNFSGAQARAYSDGKKQGFRTGQGGQQGRNGDRPQNRTGFGGPRSGAAPAPIPIEKNKAQTNKKAHKAKKEIYNKKNKEDEFFEERLLNQKKKQKEKIHNIPKQIEIMESISVSELAKKMNLKA